MEDGVGRQEGEGDHTFQHPRKVAPTVKTTITHDQPGTEPAAAPAMNRLG